MKYLIHILITLLLFATSATVAYADKHDQLEALSKQIKTITYKLERGNYDHEDLAKWTKTAIKLSSEASVCIADNEAKLKKLQESVDGLGEQVKDETKDVSLRRK